MTHLYSFDTINDITGFANGDYFASDDDVRDYFTIESMREMFGPHGEYNGSTEKILSLMADKVIQNKWHYKNKQNK